MKYFVDTSAWVAHIDKADIFHRRAKHFLNSSPLLVTSNIIVHETLALLHTRINKQVALTAGSLISNAKLVEMIIVTGEQETRAWREYKNQGKTISYVDCTTKIIMEDYGLTNIFSFDSDFDALGFRRVPK